MAALPSAMVRPDRRVLAGALAALIIAGVFGFVFPQISSYTADWHRITAISVPWLAVVAAAAAASLASSWLVIAAVLPGLRLRHAAAVNLAPSAVANTVPAGGAVALGLTWKMLASLGVTGPEFVRYTLVSGLWNVFARLGLPAAALAIVSIGRGSAGFPQVAAYLGAAALLITAVGFRALLRSERAAGLACRALVAAARLVARCLRRPTPVGLAGRVLRFRRDTSALLAARGVRITVATAAASITPWLVLLACLRASGLSQAQVSWQASLAAYALVRLLTVLPVTPGGLGVVELGLAGPLAAGLGSHAEARVAAAVLLFRAVTYLPSLPLGALAYAWWRRTRPHRSARPDMLREKSPRPGAGQSQRAMDVCCTVTFCSGGVGTAATRLRRSRLARRAGSCLRQRGTQVQELAGDDSQADRPIRQPLPREPRRGGARQDRRLRRSRGSRRGDPRQATAPGNPPGGAGLGRPADHARPAPDVESLRRGHAHIHDGGCHVVCLRISGRRRATKQPDPRSPRGSLARPLGGDSRWLREP